MSSSHQGRARGSYRPHRRANQIELVEAGVVTAARLPAYDGGMRYGQRGGVYARRAAAS
jgi:hypothetical protein